MVHSPPLFSGNIVIDKRKITAGTSYSVEMTSGGEIISRRFLTFPPDPPTDVAVGGTGIGGGTGASRSSSSSTANHRLRWRHPMGKHDRYRLTFRHNGSGGGANEDGGDGDSAPSLASFDVSGEVDSFTIDERVAKLLRRSTAGRADNGAGDGDGSGVSAGGGSKEKMRRRKGEMVEVELRTLVLPGGMDGSERTKFVCSEAETISFR